MITAPPITSFSGRYRFLSNFWPCIVSWEGEFYKSTEHAYQAAKFLEDSTAIAKVVGEDGDLIEVTMRKRLLIAKANTPGATKRLARKWPIETPNWDHYRLVVMEHLLRQKFAPRTELANLLISTGEAELVEGNTWGDIFWGVDSATGQGENHLGRLLMQIRSELGAVRTGK